MPRLGPTQLVRSRPTKQSKRPLSSPDKGRAKSSSPRTLPGSPKLGRAAAGGAVLRRGVFKTGSGQEATRQQHHLAAAAADEGARVERVRQSRVLHQKAIVLYKKGKRKEAIALNEHARMVAGLPPSDAGPVDRVIEQTGRDFVNAGVYAPFGLYETGKAGVKDIAGLSRGDVSFKHTRRIAKTVGQQVVQDVKHPLRHPGYTALDVLSAASLGAGSATRLGAAGRAFRTAARTADEPLTQLSRGARAATTRPGYKGGSLLHLPIARETALKFKGERVATRLEPDNPLLRPVHRAITKGLQKQLDAISKGKAPKGRLGEIAQNYAMGVAGREARATKRVEEARGETFEEALPKEARRRLEAGPPGVLAKTFRKINYPFRTYGVFLRPGYVATNLPGNVSMGATVQGLRNIGMNMVRARRMRKTHGDELTNWIEHQAGISRTESYEPRGEVRGLEHKAVQKITALTDTDFRRASFLFRARERGFKSKADLERLKSDPKHAQDREVISRRARKDAVDFNSLTPEEKSLVEGIFFYPWMSRATAWTGRTIANRPVKSTLIAQQSRIGKEQSQKTLGNIPRWMRGYIPTQHGLINPKSVLAQSTPADIAVQGRQVAKGLTGAAKGNAPSFGEEFGTPIVEILAGGQSLADVGSGMAPIAFLRHLGYDIPGTKPSKTFPHTGFKEALGPFMAGGLYPRRADMKVAHEQYQREVMREASSVQRIGLRTAERQQRIPAELKQIKKSYPVDSRLVAAYKGDLDALEERDKFRLAYAKKHGEQAYRSLPPANKVAAALAFLHTHSHVPKATLKMLEMQSHRLTDDKDLESLAGAMWQMSGIGQYKAAWDGLVRLTAKRKLTAKK